MPILAEEYVRTLKPFPQQKLGFSAKQILALLIFMCTRRFNKSWTINYVTQKCFGQLGRALMRIGAV